MPHPAPLETGGMLCHNQNRRTPHTRKPTAIYFTGRPYQTPPNNERTKNKVRTNHEQSKGEPWRDADPEGVGKKVLTFRGITAHRVYFVAKTPHNEFNRQGVEGLYKSLPPKEGTTGGECCGNFRKIKPPIDRRGRGLPFTGGTIGGGTKVVQKRNKKQHKKGAKAERKAEKTRTKKRRRKWYKSGAKVGQKTATIRTQREGERTAKTLENFSFAVIKNFSRLYAHDDQLKPQKKNGNP